MQDQASIRVVVKAAAATGAVESTSSTIHQRLEGLGDLRTGLEPSACHCENRWYAPRHRKSEFRADMQMEDLR
jgi:hypothetical protein